MASSASQRGFTLVELVAVIVLLGVIGAATTQFIISGVGIYQDASRRDGLSQMGRFAVERVSREVRNALPGSIRVNISAGTQCLEFMPIKGASSYLGKVSETPAISNVSVVDFSYSYTNGNRIAIYTLDQGDLYSTGSKSIATDYSCFSRRT
jgi:MSHA biogenesis protein MshO